MAIVYIHRRKDIEDPFLNVFYVGIGKFQSRSRDKRCRSYYWNNIISKHGYDIEITHKDLCWEEACAIEKYLICFYGREDLGLGKLVNLTDGGDGAIGAIVTEKQKKHLSILNKGKKHTEETKKKMSESRKGKVWNCGKKMSDETKRKLSIVHTGKKYSQERINQMKITFGGENNPMYGIKASEETRKKISESLKGEKHPQFGKKGNQNHNFGKKLPDQVKKKISAKLKGRPISEATRQAIINANKSRVWTSESRKKASESKIKYYAKTITT
jgi:hypothetical protein